MPKLISHLLSYKLPKLQDAQDLVMQNGQEKNIEIVSIKIENKINENINYFYQSYQVFLLDYWLVTFANDYTFSIFVYDACNADICSYFLQFSIFIPIPQNLRNLLEIFNKIFGNFYDPNHMPIWDKSDLDFFFDQSLIT